MNAKLRTLGDWLPALVLGALLGALASKAWQASDKPPEARPPIPRRQTGAAKKPKPPEPGWLAGTAEQKFAQIERHLRGLDVAMAEIGYRYGELLLAGKTRNWEYAQYQTEKIDLALRLAVERRPKRAKSSEPFLKESLPPVLRAIQAKKGEQLDVALETLHAGCVQCHKTENVLYFKESVDRIKERAAAPRPGSSKQAEPRTMLIEPGELRQKLHQPGLRILDTRPQPDYAGGHLPGAVRVDAKSWQDQGAKEGGFHDAKAWAELVGPLGIRRDTQVVVYGSNLTDTARVWWTLKYLGHPRVSLLNGGWPLWVQEKRPTDTALPKIAAVPFEPKFQAERLEEIGSLKKSIKSGEVTVVDARSTAEFTGKDVRGKRGGHIPGAKHLEWKELLAQDGRFKVPAQLRELFHQRGIKPEQTTVTC